tara:strand:- start:3915 stop:4892 length:978 start_codon:yes stop_codon:yes gene_type:complete
MPPPDFRRLRDASFNLQTKATEDFEELAEALAENIGRRIAASLGVDPDTVFPADGSDGRMVGRTRFEQLLQGVTGDDAVRAVVLASGLEDIEDFVAQSGSAAARRALTDAVGDLAGLAERSLVAQGIAAEGALDTVAAEALIGSYITNTMDESLRSTIDRSAAVRIRQGIIANIGQMSIAEMAQQIALEQDASVPQATTEARTQLAEADRFVNETVRKSVDPEGDKFLLAYLGPDDKITRPFCDHLVNKAFKLSDFNQARNGQTATHPRISGGGYNCRHDVRAVIDDDKVLSDLRLQRGTLADIQAANAAAKPKRKKKRKGRRRR